MLQPLCVLMLSYRHIEFLFSLFLILGKRRREEANFPGASIILDQIKKKPSKRRVGLIVSGAIARCELTIA